MKITLVSNIESLSEFYLQTLVLLYRPWEVFGKNDASTSSLYVKTEMCDGRVKAYVRICDNGKECESFSSQGEYENYPDGINIAKTVVGRAFCDCAQKVYGIKSPFGIITGIRPAKLALSYLERGFSATEIRKIFADKEGRYLEKCREFCLKNFEKQTNLNEYLKLFDEISGD